MLTYILYVILALLRPSLPPSSSCEPSSSNGGYAALIQFDGVPVDGQQVAEHLAAAVRCKTVPLDDSGTPTSRH